MEVFRIEGDLNTYTYHKTNIFQHTNDLADYGPKKQVFFSAFVSGTAPPYVVGSLYYEIQNFSPDSGNSIQDLGEIMQELKGSRKYRSMTMSQYLALPSERANEARAAGLPGFSLFFGILALFLIWRYTSS